MGAEPPMQGDAAAAGAMRVDQRRDFAVEPGLRQRLDHDVALPRVIGRVLPMLDRAAAAHAEMRAERFDPLGARDLDREQLAAIGMVARNAIDLDGLAAECIGHVDRLAFVERDTIAAMADMIDGQAFNHGARPGRIRHCRRRR